MYYVQRMKISRKRSQDDTFNKPSMDDFRVPSNSSCFMMAHPMVWKINATQSTLREIKQGIILVQ